MALGSGISVTGVCVRRSAALQQARIKAACEGLATLLKVTSKVADDDIKLIDDFLAPGYGLPSDATLSAIVLGARTEALMVDPVYTGKVLAAVIREASNADKESTFLFVHTGGTPALFAYQQTMDRALAVEH